MSLLERNWLEEIRLDWSAFANANGIVKSKLSKLDSVLDKFKDVFTEELDHCTGVKVKLYAKESSVPQFHCPRPVPLAMRTKIEAEIQRQVDLSILEKVDIAEWAAPIVPVIKPSGEICLCGDYKVSINPHLEINQYPLPHPELARSVVCSPKWRSALHQIRSLRSIPSNSIGGAVQEVFGDKHTQGSVSFY